MKKFDDDNADLSGGHMYGFGGLSGEYKTLGTFSMSEIGAGADPDFDVFSYMDFCKKARQGNLSFNWQKFCEALSSYFHLPLERVKTVVANFVRDAGE